MPEITMDELQAEYAKLDALRKTNCRGNDMTDEQFRLVHYARTGDKTVSYTDLARYWKEKKWGDIKAGTIRERYTRELIKRGM